MNDIEQKFYPLPTYIEVGIYMSSVLVVATWDFAPQWYRCRYIVRVDHHVLYGVERFVEGLGIDFDECVRICEVDVYGDDFLGVVENVSAV